MDSLTEPRQGRCEYTVTAGPQVIGNLPPAPATDPGAVNDDDRSSVLLHRLVCAERAHGK